MTPVRVQEPDKKEEDKKKKKGLLAQLLSLLGRGGAGAASGIGTATVATVTTTGASALGFFATKAGLFTLLIGGGAVAAGVGVLGSQFVGGPTSNVVKEDAFATKSHGVKSSKGEEGADGAPSRMTVFGEGIKFAGDEEAVAGGEEHKDEAAPPPSGTASSSGGISPAGSSFKDSALASSKTGGTSFGPSSVMSGGGGGGSGSAAAGKGLTGAEGTRIAGKKGKITGLSKQTKAVADGGRQTKSVAGQRALGRLRTAASLSRKGAQSTDYQKAAGYASKAITGGTMGGGTGTVIGGGKGGGAGLGDGTNTAPTASPSKPSAGEFTPPDVKKEDFKKSCEKGKATIPDQVRKGMKGDEAARFEKQCAAKHAFQQAAMWLAGAGALLAILGMLGGPATGDAYDFKRIAAMIVYGAIIVAVLAKVIAPAIKYMGADGMQMEAVGLLIGGILVVAMAGKALYESYQIGSLESENAKRLAAAQKPVREALGKQADSSKKVNELLGEAGKNDAKIQENLGKLQKLDPSSSQLDAKGKFQADLKQHIDYEDAARAKSTDLATNEKFRPKMAENASTYKDSALGNDPKGDNAVKAANEYKEGQKQIADSHKNYEAKVQELNDKYHKQPVLDKSGKPVMENGQPKFEYDKGKINADAGFGAKPESLEPKSPDPSQMKNGKADVSPEAARDLRINNGAFSDTGSAAGGTGPGSVDAKTGRHTDWKTEASYQSNKEFFAGGSQGATGPQSKTVAEMLGSKDENVQRYGKLWQDRFEKTGVTDTSKMNVDWDPANKTPGATIEWNPNTPPPPPPPPPSATPVATDTRMMHGPLPEGKLDLRMGPGQPTMQGEPMARSDMFSQQGQQAPPEAGRKINLNLETPRTQDLPQGERIATPRDFGADPHRAEPAPAATAPAEPKTPVAKDWNEFQKDMASQKASAGNESWDSKLEKVGNQAKGFTQQGGGGGGGGEGGGGPSADQQQMQQQAQQAPKAAANAQPKVDAASRAGMGDMSGKGGGSSVSGSITNADPTNPEGLSPEELAKKQAEGKDVDDTKSLMEKMGLM